LIDEPLAAIDAPTIAESFAALKFKARSRPTAPESDAEHESSLPAHPI